jgi:hypothetical protein
VISEGALLSGAAEPAPDGLVSHDG